MVLAVFDRRELICADFDHFDRAPRQEARRRPAEPEEPRKSPARVPQESRKSPAGGPRVPQESRKSPARVPQESRQSVAAFPLKFLGARCFSRISDDFGGSDRAGGLPEVLDRAGGLPEVLDRAGGLPEGLDRAGRPPEVLGSLGRAGRGSGGSFLGTTDIVVAIVHRRRRKVQQAHRHRHRCRRKVQSNTNLIPQRFFIASDLGPPIVVPSTSLRVHLVPCLSKD